MSFNLESLDIFLSIITEFNIKNFDPENLDKKMIQNISQNATFCFESTCKLCDPITLQDFRKLSLFYEAIFQFNEIFMINNPDLQKNYIQMLSSTVEKLNQQHLIKIA